MYCRKLVEVFFVTARTSSCYNGYLTFGASQSMTPGTAHSTPENSFLEELSLKEMFAGKNVMFLSVIK